MLISLKINKNFDKNNYLKLLKQIKKIKIWIVYYKLKNYKKYWVNY